MVTLLGGKDVRDKVIDCVRQMGVGGGFGTTTMGFINKDLVA